MIVVCEGLERGLEEAWYELQRAVEGQNPGVSQAKLDELCVEKIRQLAFKITIL